MRVPRKELVLCGCTLAILGCTSALAQGQEIQRALVQHHQQSAGFALQLSQSQEQVQLAPGDNRQLNDRQRLKDVSGPQSLTVEKEPPQAPRPYEREKAAEERMFVLPPPVVRAQPLPKQVPLPARSPAVPGDAIVPSDPGCASTELLPTES